VRTEAAQFSLADFHSFQASIKPSAAAFKTRQQAAFNAERERWAAAGAFVAPETPQDNGLAAEAPAPDGCRPVRAPVTANVWSSGVDRGARVTKGQRLVIREEMKMEVAVAAPAAGVIEALDCSAGSIVQSGQRLLYLRVDE